MTPESPTVGSLWHVVRRRWLVVVLPIVLVPVAVTALSLLQSPRHNASAEVLLQRQDLANAVIGAAGGTSGTDAVRDAETQARLATVLALARRTLAKVDVEDLTPAEFLENLSVTLSGNSDILRFSVTDRDAVRARLLATAHAREYVAYRQELDSAAIRRARAHVAERLRLLSKQQQRSSPLYSVLEDLERQIATIDTLQVARATLIEAARDTEQVAPKPVRNAGLALLFGVVLGLGAAFVLEALDTRVRRADEVARRLDTHLLGRLPQPSRELRRRRRPVMLETPHSIHAEAYRLLRTNLEFAALGSETAIIELTSAVEGEGKTTTVTNLAVALAQAGRDVVLVDLDLRRPGVGGMFGFPASGGLTDVVLGNLSPYDALIRVNVKHPALSAGDHAAATLDLGGSLRVLPAGRAPSSPGELVGSQDVQAVLARLAEESDVVLVDTPPLLRVGDAMAISSFVDGVLLVLRISELRRAQLAELCRITQHMPAPLLGLIVTGEGDEGAYYYSVPETAGRGEVSRRIGLPNAAVKPVSPEHRAARRR